MALHKFSYWTYPQTCLGYLINNFSQTSSFPFFPSPALSRALLYPLQVIASPVLLCSYLTHLSICFLNFFHACSASPHHVDDENYFDPA
jgi:hypothetical protein